MNRIEINFQGQKLPLLFGSWVMGQLIKSGYALADIGLNLSNNPFDFIPTITHLAAINETSTKDKEAFNIYDFYQWFDENGGVSSPEVAKVLKCFTTSLGLDVPESKKKELKTIAKISK